MTRRRSRTILTTVAGLATAGLLAGCSAGGSTERPDEVDLTVSVWGEVARADLYQQVLDGFVETQDGVTATMEFADRGPYFERLTTNAASRNLPDVFWLTDTYFGRYAGAGALLDLTPYLGEQIDVDSIGEDWLPYGEYDGTVYALPSHFNGQAVLIDQVVFDERGVEYSAESWDDLADLAREMARPDEGYYGIIDPTVGITQRPFEAWVRQHDQELFDEEGQLGFDEDLLVDWWEYWAALRDEGVAPTPDVQIESDSQGFTNDLLVARKAAIRLSSATHLNQAGVLRDGGLALQTYPEIDGVAEDWRFYTALLVTAAANTPAPEVAAELLNTLVNDLESAEISKISMGTPTPTSVSEGIAPLLSEDDQEIIAYLNEERSNPTRPTPVLPETSEQFTASLTRFSQEVAYGRMSPAEAATALFSDADRYL